MQACLLLIDPSGCIGIRTFASVCFAEGLARASARAGVSIPAGWDGRVVASLYLSAISSSPQ